MKINIKSQSSNIQNQGSASKQLPCLDNKFTSFQWFDRVPLMQVCLLADWDRSGNIRIHKFYYM